MGRISQKLNFQLDGNGNGEVTYSKYTFGITIQAQAKILQPKGNYHVELFVNGKSKLSNDISDNQSISAKIKTSFLSSTQIKVTIHSDNVRNQKGSIQLDASY